MLRKMHVLLGLCLMIGLMSCSRSLVKSDYDREINFANYKTYDWMAEPEKPGNNGLVRNTLFEKRFKKAVDKELTANGFQKRTEKPDFLIAYYIRVKDKIDVTSTGFDYWPAYYGFGFRSRLYGFGYRSRFFGASSLDVRQYKEGTLILDFVDPETKELIWRGWYSGMIDDASSIKVKKLNNAVEHILEQFPPQS